MPLVHDFTLQDVRAALDQAALVSITDSHGNIIYANDLFLKRTLYSREEVIGKNHRMFNSGLHPKEFWAEFWHTIQSGRIFKGLVRDQAKDGSFAWFDSTVVPFLDREGKPYQYVAIRFDVTDRIETHEQLEQERKLRGYVERLAALGEMTSAIGHEINNPMSTILARVQLTKRLALAGRTTPEALIQSMEQVEQMVERIETIIRGLGMFSREASHDPFQKIRIEAILEDALRFCRVRFKSSGIELRVRGIETGAELECRPIQLSQVLLNLLNNAHDAVSKLKERWVEVEVRDCGQEVMIAVTDSGHGIPNAIADRIMEPFFSTKEVGKGTGLGLSISKGIAESHRGSLQLDRAHPNTRFILCFPKAQPNPDFRDLPKGPT